MKTGVCDGPLFTTTAADCMKPRPLFEDYDLMNEYLSGDISYEDPNSFVGFDNFNSSCLCPDIPPLGMH